MAKHGHWKNTMKRCILMHHMFLNLLSFQGGRGDHCRQNLPDGPKPLHCCTAQTPSRRDKTGDPADAAIHGEDGVPIWWGRYHGVGRLWMCSLKVEVVKWVTIYSQPSFRLLEGNSTIRTKRPFKFTSQFGPLNPAKKIFLNGGLKQGRRTNSRSILADSIIIHQEKGPEWNILKKRQVALVFSYELCIDG